MQLNQKNISSDLEYLHLHFHVIHTDCYGKYRDHEIDCNLEAVLFTESQNAEMRSEIVRRGILYLQLVGKSAFLV